MEKLNSEHWYSVRRDFKGAERERNELFIESVFPKMKLEEKMVSVETVHIFYNFIDLCLFDGLLKNLF